MADNAVPKVQITRDVSTPTSELAPTLTCEILPMFAYKNWLCLSREDHELLKPVLQLATMFLGTPACLGFFATLLFGKRTCDEKSVTRIEKESPLTNHKVETIIEMFDDLAGLYKLTFQTIKATGTVFANTWSDLTDTEREDLLWQRRRENPTPWSVRKSLKHGKLVDMIQGAEREFCWGSPPNNDFDSWPPAEKEPDKHLQDPRTRMTPCTIALSAKLFSNLKGQRHSPAQRLKNNFRLAAVILHEIAHAVESGRPECRECNVGEVTFPGEVLPELGHQLEKLVFGGAPYPMPLDPRSYEVVFGSSLDESQVPNTDEHVSWLGFTEWPMRSTSKHYALPLEYMAHVQQHWFWDAAAQVADPRDQSLWHLPKTMPFEGSAELSRFYMDGLVASQGRKRAAKHYAVYDD